MRYKKLEQLFNEAPDNGLIDDRKCVTLLGTDFETWSDHVIVYRKASVLNEVNVGDDSLVFGYKVFGLRIPFLGRDGFVIAIPK